MRFEISRAMNGPGGQGVGGILLGSRAGDQFRIVGFQPIPCEHALGPDFRLSAREETGLSALLKGWDCGAGTRDTQPLGWFVSHPRGDRQLTAEEKLLHQKVFLGGQLVMVAKPDRLGEVDVAVYYAPDDAGCGPRLVEPALSVIPDASFRPARRAATPRREARDGQVSPPDAPTAPLSPAASRKGMIVAAVVALLLVSAGGALLWNWLPPGPTATTAAASRTPMQMLSLHVYEDNGRFYISWDGQADAIQRASRIVLSIRDGAQTERLDLSPAEAAPGFRLHRRTGPEVTVTLAVHSENGGVMEESTRFVSSDFTPPTLLRVTPDTSPAEVFDPSAIPPGPSKY